MWGTYIRPAPGSELEEYDPWQEASNENRRSQRPYQVLLSLFEDVRASEFLSSTLAPGSEQRVLDWCSRHGLLGLLPHETVSITLAARWDAMDNPDPSPGVVHPSISTYTRLANGWLGRRRGYGSYIQGPTPGSALTLEEYRPDMPRPHALMQELSDDQLVERDIASAWGRYFPGVALEHQQAAFEYPVPLSDEFWRMYAEPVRDFMRGAAALHRAVESLKRFVEEGPDSQDKDDVIRSGLSVLPRLLAPVGTDMVLDEAGRPSLKWLPNSLLSAYTLMAVEDFAAGQIPSRCPACRQYFTVRSQMAVYCSERCRQAAQKRAQRARKKGGKVNGS